MPTSPALSPRSPRSPRSAAQRALLAVAIAALASWACTPVTDAPPPGGDPDAGRIAWLGEHASPVRTLDPADPDLSDLEPLRAIVGDARIVMLGEQTHGDGTAFEAKVRMIRFLHEEMGFDIVAFEAGMFDVREAWRDLRSGADHRGAVSNAIFEIWSQSREVEPLFAYIAARAGGPAPLELAGIDPQFTGPVGAGTGARFVGALEAHLAAHASPIYGTAGWFEFAAVAERIALQWYRGTPMTEAEHAALEEVGVALMAETARLRDVQPSAAARFWAQMADALVAQGRAWHSLSPGGSGASLGYGTIRDASMARNLAWLAAENPGRRIVVWAHSAHIASAVHTVAVASNGTRLFPATHRPLGQIAREQFGEQLVTIGFLGGAGQYGYAGVHSGEVPPPVTVATPPGGSLDSLLLATGHEHLLLDLRRGVAAPGGAWLLEERVARPFHYLETAASWPAVFDAFFMSARVAPATAITR